MPILSFPIRSFVISMLIANKWQVKKAGGQRKYLSNAYKEGKGSCRTAPREHLNSGTDFGYMRTSNTCITILYSQLIGK